MTSTASSANQIIHGPPLPASPAMRKALEDHVLPISGRRNAGDLVGLGAHFRLFKKNTSTTGGILPVYNAWISGHAGPVAHPGIDISDIMAENGSPLMHSLRLDLSTHIARRLAPFAKAYIQSFDLICANEGVIIFRRDQGTTSTDIIAIENLELIGAIPWDFCSGHQLLALKDYASIHLVAER